MKKIFLSLLLLLFLLTGCYYTKFDGSGNFIIDKNNTQSVIFQENEMGYSTSEYFLFRMSNASNPQIVGLYEGKIYENNLVSKIVIDDRNFTLLNYINNTIFVTNNLGLQELIYNQKEKVASKAITSDTLSGYKQNGFSEVVRYQNEEKYLEMRSKASSTNIFSDVANQNIQAVSLNTKIISLDSERIQLTRLHNYCLINNQNQLVVRTTSSGYIYKENESEENYTNIDISTSEKVIFDEAFAIKKAIFVINGQKDFLYIITNDNTIYSYNLQTDEYIIKDTYNNILLFKQYEDFVYIVNGNKIIILDETLTEVHNTEVELYKTIAGASWYNDGTESYIRYAVIESNTLKLARVDFNLDDYRNSKNWGSYNTSVFIYLSYCNFKKILL